MKSMLQLAITACVVLATVKAAMAYPNAIYNPATGNIVLTNDTGLTLAAITLKSQGNLMTTDPSKVMAIPGAIRDTADLPFGIAFLNMPPGDFNIGNVVTPGTPTSDLYGEWYISLTLPPNPLGAPEPAASGMASAGLLALVAGRRNGRKRGF